MKSQPDAPADRPAPRRDHLVATAARLFCRDGFHATGIDRVLDEAGVAKMTLYKHFPSKDDLIVASLGAVADASRSAVEGAIEAAGRSPRRRLLGLVDWYARQASSAQFEGCPFHHATAEFSDPAHPIHRAARDQKLWLRDLLEGIARDAGLRRPAHVAEQLLVVIEGVLAAAAVGALADGPRSARALARAVVDGAA